MKRARVDLRASEAENELWERAAARAGLSKSELIRRAANAHAADVLNNTQVTFGSGVVTWMASEATSVTTTGLA